MIPAIRNRAYAAVAASTPARAFSSKVPFSMQNSLVSRGVSRGRDPGGSRTVVIAGSGAIGTQTALKAASLHDKVVVCSNSSSQLERAVKKAGLPEGRISFVPTSYEQGRDPEHWKSICRKVSAEASSVHAVNTRGTSTLQPGQTYDETIRQPAVALLQGFAEGTPSTIERTFVNCSSSTASIPGFVAKNKYARARYETDLDLEEHAQREKIPGLNLRFDHVKSSEGVNTTTNPNHGCSPLELSHSAFQVVIEDEDLLTTQPVSEDQATDAILCRDLVARGTYKTIDAVGPKAYSQRELYEFYSDLFGRKLRIIRVPFSVAEWASKHTPIAQLTYGVDLLKHRSEHTSANQSLDSTEFEKVVGAPLLTIEQIYESFGGRIVGVRSPTQMLIRTTGRKLIDCSFARKDFVSGVLPHVPYMIGQAAAHMLTPKP